MNRLLPLVIILPAVRLENVSHICLILSGVGLENWSIVGVQLEGN